MTPLPPRDAAELADPREIAMQQALALVGNVAAACRRAREKLPDTLHDPDERGFLYLWLQYCDATHTGFQLDYLRYRMRLAVKVLRKARSQRAWPVTVESRRAA